MPIKTKVLEKISNILYCFSPEHPVWTATELSKKLSIPVTTLHGILADLVTLDFLEQDKYSKTYKIGFRFIEMGELFTNNFELNNIAHGFMRDLTSRVETLVGLSIIHKNWMYVSMSTLPSKISNSTRYVGPKILAHNSTGGKVILAHLPVEQQQKYFSSVKENALLPSDFDETVFLEELVQIRQQGYACLWNDGEKDIPLSIAAPIFGRERQILASLVVITPYQGMTPDKIPSIKQNLLESANQITLRCGHISFNF